MLRRIPGAALAVLLAGCSSSDSAPAPTAPTAPGAALQRNLNLTGSWTGTYSISSCQPTGAPNSCRSYSTPGNVELQLTQSGKDLTGTMRTDRIGTLAVSGSVDDAGVVTLSGEGRGPTQCFGLSTGIQIVNRTDRWSAEVTKTGAIAGTFAQYRLQTLSSCYTALFEYRTEITSLVRVIRP